MSAIAEAGHGEFFFIRGQEDMEKVVRVATAGFRSLFATEATVSLTALNGATISHAYAPGNQQGESTTSMQVSLGDLRSGDARTVLVDLLLPGLDTTTEYLAYNVEYIPTGATEPARQHGHATVRVVGTGAQPAEPNTAVLLYRKLQRHLLREKDILDKIESGDLDHAHWEEDALEKDLHAVAQAACISQDTGAHSYTCSRAKAAWGRTKESLSLFESGMSQSESSKRYKFKRQMNEELSILKDEL